MIEDVYSGFEVPLNKMFESLLTKELDLNTNLKEAIDLDVKTPLL